MVASTASLRLGHDTLKPSAPDVRWCPAAFMTESMGCCMQVNVGIGTLAGSTIMLLTVAWGGSLLAGRCDLDEKVCSWGC